MGTTSAQRATCSQLRWPFLVKTKRTLFLKLASICKQRSTRKKKTLVNLRSCCLLKIKMKYLLLKDSKSVASVKSIFFFANTFQATHTKSENSKSSHTLDWGERKDFHKIASSSFRSDRRCFRTLLRKIRERKEFGFFRWYEIMKK